MDRTRLATLTLALAAVLGAGAVQAGLTEAETRWLRTGGPVLEDARRLGLPLDIVVQPQDTPGAVPLAMGFVDGRCKLVLSMRGNPQAESALEGVDASLAPVVVEAMVAHEVGHCWRWVQGAWHGLPAGFEAAATPGLDAATAEAWREMRATRREEGYADLVGLAWTARHHPDRYAEVHAWLTQVRAEGPAGNHHDTRAWLRLAADAAAFGGAGTPFEQAGAPWRRGLLHDD